MPASSLPASDAPGDLAACRALLRAGSKSFFAASLLLPARVREPATALYAFCRIADDAVDLGGESGRVDALHRRLDAAYAGRPLAHPVDRALARVVAGERLPRQLLDALLEGFAWDIEGRRYATFDALESYAVRVAGTVGLMMAMLMGVRQPSVLARSLDLGIAMQLTNIARDIGEDARAGRIYLPLAWLAECGVDPDAFLRRPEPTPAMRGLAARLLAAARIYYERADAGIAALPADCRPAILAARRIYAEIGAAIAANGHDAVGRRAVVGGGRKLALLAAAYARPVSARPTGAEIAEAGRPLVACVANVPWTADAGRRSLDDRLGSVVDIFARLERGSRAPAGP